MGSISAADADKVVVAAVAHAETIGYRVTVVVADTGGEIVAMRRMDGVSPFMFDLAYSFAYTGALFRRSGDQLAAIENETWFAALSRMRGGRVAVAGPCKPIWSGDELVGGIGVAGAPTEKDVVIMDAGLAGLGLAVPTKGPYK